jgi:hypothetical protein
MSTTTGSDMPSSGDDGVWEERAEIRAEICAVIEKHNDGTEKPPFTASELIVMAFFCSRWAHLDFCQVLEHIVAFFKYYRCQALEQYAITATYPKERAKPGMVVEGYIQAIDDWSAPFVDPYNSAIIKHDNTEDDPELTIPITAGRIFLRRWLEPQRMGTFNFLKLPAELRNRIYDLVFALPPSGAGFFDTPYDHTGVVVMNRETDNVVESSTWGDVNDRELLRLPSMQTILALLSVNKQIHSEAKSHFYEINAFYFDHLEAFSAFVMKTGITRLIRLGHLKLDFHPQDEEDPDIFVDGVKDFSLAVAKLQRCKSIAKLELIVRENWWLRAPAGFRRAFNRATPYKRPQTLPFIGSLVELAAKAKKLEIDSDRAPTLAKYVKDQVLVLRAKETAKAKPKKQRKRKANSTDDVEKGSDKMTKRAKASK